MIEKLYDIATKMVYELGVRPKITLNGSTLIFTFNFELFEIETCLTITTTGVSKDNLYFLDDISPKFNITDAEAIEEVISITKFKFKNKIKEYEDKMKSLEKIKTRLSEYK